jgi:glucosamine-6-phosphate deaminase
MRIVVTQDPESFNRRSAREVADQIRNKPDSVLGFATGNTTEGVYRELVSLHREGQLDFGHVSSFVLDEYEGAFLDNPASCAARMTAQLFGQVNMQKNHIYLMDSMAADLDRVCAEYEEQIRKSGGIDLQILGIGTNGHIAFNEPGTAFHSITRVVNVGEQTRTARAGMFSASGEVPRKGVTMGIKTIMNAGRILLLAEGADKAGIIRETLLGPVDAKVPASVLQLHPFLTVILDTQASKELNLAFAEE